MKKKQERKRARIMEQALEMSQLQAANMDPNGSWTGQPLDLNEVPVQDADDL